MSSGRPAGFMGGEEEGALLPGPGRCDGCLQAFRGLATPSAAAGLDGGLGWLRLQQESLRTQRGGGKGSEAAGQPWGVFTWHI